MTTRKFTTVEPETLMQVVQMPVGDYFYKTTDTGRTVPFIRGVTSADSTTVIATSLVDGTQENIPADTNVVVIKDMTVDFKL